MARYNYAAVRAFFHLGGHRHEIAIDKRGKPRTFEFGRPLPPWGHPNRQELMRVPETLHFMDPKRPVYHGRSCGNCAHFEDCSLPQVKNAKPDQNYCAYPSRGYTSMVAVWAGQDELPPRDPWRGR